MTTAQRATPPPPRWVRWFSVGVIVLGTGAFFAVSDVTLADETHPLVLPLWVVLYVLAAAMLLDGLIRDRLPVPLPAALLGFVVLAALSVTWSIEPGLTLRRSVALLGTVVVGMALAQRLRPVDVFDSVRAAMLLVGIASLVFYLSGDAKALDEIHGTLRGVLSTKNSMGRAMAVGIIASVITAFLDRRRILTCAASAAFMVVPLGLTQSAGAVLLAVSVLGAVTVVMAVRHRRGSLVTAAGGCLVVGTALATATWWTPERLTGLVGKDPTLTGRDAIWSQSLDAVRDKLLLGYGYGAFWEASEPADQIRARLFWDVPNGHSGLLDVALDLGLVGVALALLVLAGLVVRSVRDASRGDRATAGVRLGVLLLVLVSTAVESGLLTQNSLLGVLTAVAAAMPSPGQRPVRVAADQAQRPGVGPPDTR